jgi:hypothetical protein
MDPKEMIKCMGNQELLRRFEELAVEHLKASEEGDFEAANLSVDETGRIVKQLWRDNGSTKEALRELVELSKSKNPAVAMKAVTYTLELYPEVANELRRLKKEKSLIGLGAECTLKRWKEGQQTILKELLGL